MLLLQKIQNQAIPKNAVITNNIMAAFCWLFYFVNSVLTEIHCNNMIGNIL